MMPLKKNIVIAAITVFSLLFSHPAWAVLSPEPQSGGKFFPGKGTRAADAYSYEEYPYYENNASYSRTETGSFDRSHYAKGLKLGILDVRPSLGYTGEYDSNIFLTQKDAQADYINRLVGGVDAYMPMDGGKYVLMAGVQNRTEWFVDHNEENHSDWTYQLGGEINLAAASLAIHNEFKDTSDRSDSELTSRIERFENRLGGILTVPFGQFFSETEASDFIVNYRDNDALTQFNRHEITVLPRLGLNVGARTQALLEYGITNISYEKQDDRDALANQIQMGIRGTLGQGDLISYQAWGGWQVRHYDNGSFNDFNSVIGHGELTYAPTEISKFILKAIRRPEESIDDGQAYYTRNEVNLRYRRQIAESWFVHAQGGTGFNHYSNDRLDFLWEPGAGVEYVLPGKILALFSEYRFSSRHSDQGERDYRRHIANFGIKAQV